MEIDINEFGKLDIRVGTILTAEEIQGANKLLKLTVDVGEQKPRTLVAGIKVTYSPEDLIGHQAIVICNLKPAVIRGVTSQGMMLAADSEFGPVLLVPDKAVDTGTKIR